MPNFKIDVKTNQLFLLDGLGALLSAILLGGVLPLLQAWIGMPLKVLFSFAAIASLLACYSLYCAFRVRQYRPLHLKTIIFANLGYCSLSTLMIFVYWIDLTPLGVFYFINEKLLVLALVAVENSALKRLE